MGIKLHRHRRSVFRSRRRPFLTAIAWIAAAAAVVALGFFGAKHLNEQPVMAPEDTSSADVTVPSTDQSDADGDTSAPPSNTPTDTTIHGFYLPFTALTDGVTLSGKLEQAAEAGFTHVVFDLKDSEGMLYYRFTSPQAVQVNSFTENALSADALKNLFGTIRAAGLQPIVRLFAFRDHLGAKALSGARISLAENSGWVWYDGEPQNGGRAWLNPYADEAQQYILALMQELRAAGVAAILLDGVEFPEHTYSANFGSSSNTNMSRHEILSTFVKKARSQSENCPILLGSTCQGALGSDTIAYGNNPLTFAPDFAAPAILPSDLPSAIKVGEATIQNTPDSLQQTVEALVGQMVLRTKVMAEDKQPALSPWLQAAEYSAAQIRQEIAGCLAGGANSYILYHPLGSYDFAALKIAG